MHLPITLAISIATLGVAAIADAQPADAARRRDTQRAAAAAFLDRNRPEAERLAAVPRMGYPDKATFAALLATAATRNESDPIRLEALKKHRFSAEWLDLVLKILNDPSDGGPLLDSELTEHLNRRATFKLPAEVRQRIQATWRRLLDDPRDPVRLSAYRVLVANHDPVAVERLSEALRTRSRMPIPLTEAIELLDLNGATNHMGTLRPYLRHDDAGVRARSANVLAADPQSQARIVQMATSSQSPEEVRVQALRGLAREDEGFGSYAIPIVEDAREDGDVRFAAMHAFAGRMNYHRVPTADQIRFAQAVESVAGDQKLLSPEAGSIREEARKLLEYLKKAFPAIAQFYANR